MHECRERHAVRGDLLNESASMRGAERTYRAVSVCQLLYLSHPQDRQPFQCVLTPLPLHILDEVCDAKARKPRDPVGDNRRLTSRAEY